MIIALQGYFSFPWAGREEGRDGEPSAVQVDAPCLIPNNRLSFPQAVVGIIPRTTPSHNPVIAHLSFMWLIWVGCAAIWKTLSYRIQHDDNEDSFRNATCRSVIHMARCQPHFLKHSSCLIINGGMSPSSESVSVEASHLLKYDSRSTV